MAYTKRAGDPAEWAAQDAQMRREYWRRVEHRLHDALWNRTGSGCSYCGETEFSPNVEAFELSGEIVCDECAEEIFEENGQFGAGA